MVQVLKYLSIAGLGWLSGFMYGLTYGERIEPTPTHGEGGGSW
jgi:hypothetical protein